MHAGFHDRFIRKKVALTRRNEPFRERQVCHIIVLSEGKGAMTTFFVNNGSDPQALDENSFRSRKKTACCPNTRNRRLSPSKIKTRELSRTLYLRSIREVLRLQKITRKLRNLECCISTSEDWIDRINREASERLVYVKNNFCLDKCATYGQNKKVGINSIKNGCKLHWYSYFVHA